MRWPRLKLDAAVLIQKSFVEVRVVRCVFFFITNSVRILVLGRTVL
jgi:hypothetical protein